MALSGGDDAMIAKFPVLVNRRSSNTATPFCAVLSLVPASLFGPPGPVLLTATLAADVVTRLPWASRISTCIGGASVCWSDADGGGPTKNRSLAAGPGVTSNAALVVFSAPDPATNV